MTDEAPKRDPDPPPPLPSAEVRQARRLNKPRMLPGKKPGKMNVTDVVMGSVCITLVSGVILAIAIPGLCSSTRGARYSVRIEWERRNAELDAAAEQARKDGKLPPAPGTKPRE